MAAVYSSNISTSIMSLPSQCIELLHGHSKITIITSTHADDNAGDIENNGDVDDEDYNENDNDNTFDTVVMIMIIATVIIILTAISFGWLLLKQKYPHASIQPQTGSSVPDGTLDLLANTYLPALPKCISKEIAFNSWSSQLLPEFSLKK